jgi:hypothetical protein
MKSFLSFNEFIGESETKFFDMWEAVNMRSEHPKYNFIIGCHTTEDDDHLNLYVLLECIQTKGIELVSASPFLLDMISKEMEPISKKYGVTIENHSNPIYFDVLGVQLYFVNRVVGNAKERTEFTKRFDQVFEDAGCKKRGLVWVMEDVTMDPAPMIKCLKKI